METDNQHYPLSTESEDGRPNLGIRNPSIPSIITSCAPREDLLKGTFNPEIFTASLSQVIDYYRGKPGMIDTLYTDAGAFFQQVTYPSQGLRTVLTEVFARLAGDATAPAIHRLETAFGGGKTHTLVALAHLGFRGTELTATVRSIIGDLPLFAPGDVAVVGIAGDELPVHKPKGSALAPYTLWGEITYQVGGTALYGALEVESDSAAAPGRGFLEKVFQGRKVLLLLDELAQYAARLQAARPDATDQLAAFLMGLNGYARTRSGLAVVLTLASHRDAFAGQTQRLAQLLTEVAGKDIGQDTAAAIAERAQEGIRSVVARDATTVVPVQASEISRVLAKRLFERVDDAAAQETADTYTAIYARSATTLPDDATRADFRNRLVEHYPFHPTLISFLNEKLATVETFQGTRGVLRVLALAVRNLWQTNPPISMIHACHLDLRDARIVNEVIGRIGSGELLTVLNTDIGGPDTGVLAAGRSRSELLDVKNPHPLGLPLYRYTWQTVFLHSLVGRAQGLGSNLFGISGPDAVFATAFPGMTPPQIEAALKQIEDLGDGAFYLRFNQGRYYASLEPSLPRALASIRGGLGSEQVAEALIQAARKVVTKEVGPFYVVHDVYLPEHLPDKVDRPVLGIVAPDAGEETNTGEGIDVEAFITTKGPNQPRLQQNGVFLLMPDTVRVSSEVWSEERALWAQETRSRVEDLARTVLAMSRLKERPEDHGLSAQQLARESFDTQLKERRHALLTAVTQLYTRLWFPSASGHVVNRALKSAGGEGGVPVVEALRRVLKAEGELITDGIASTQETLAALAKYFFELGPTPSVAEIREAFACNRRWPVLEQAAIFDQILRAGISQGQWCLFTLSHPAGEGRGEGPVPVARFYSRDSGDLPLDLDLALPEWSLVSIEGAKQRGWGPKAAPDAEMVEQWVAQVLNESRSAHVKDILAEVKDRYGAPEEPVREALGHLLRTDRAAVYTGEPVQTERPEELRHGSASILYPIQPSDVVMSIAEAGSRGWTSAADRRFVREGAEIAERVLTLLPRLGGWYRRGTQTTFATLELSDLEVEGGARLRLTLENATPAAIGRLAELLEVLPLAVHVGPTTEAYIEVAEPNEQCPIMQALSQEKES
jgi:hypothetical protein